MVSAGDAELGMREIYMAMWETFIYCILFFPLQGASISQPVVNLGTSAGNTPESLPSKPCGALRPVNGVINT